MSVGASGDTGVTAKGRHQGSCCSAPPVSASLIKYFSLLLSSSQADIFATVAFTVPCLFVHRRLRDGTAWLRIKGWHTNCHRVLCRHTTACQQPLRPQTGLSRCRGRVEELPRLPWHSEGVRVQLWKQTAGRDVHGSETAQAMHGQQEPLIRC